MEKPEKPVVAVVERGPNYVFHLLAVAGVGYQSDYGERYRHTVNPRERQWLESLRDLLTFQDGRSGALVSPALFLPAYLSLDSAEAFWEYFDRLARGPEDPDAFLERYRPHLQELTANWVQVYDQRWLAEGRGFRETLLQLGEVMARNHEPFCADVWPLEQPGIAAVADRLNHHFAGHDVIGAWERFTGLDWKSDSYQIVLVSPIKNGPQANSLGYERNVFYPYSDFDWMTRFISHETGTHILIDIIKGSTPAGSGGRVRLGEGGSAYDFGLVYRGYENLCRFFNGLILGLHDDLYAMGPDYRSDEFQRVYREKWEREPMTAPLALLVEAVERLGGGPGEATAEAGV